MDFKENKKKDPTINRAFESQHVYEHTKGNNLE